MDAAGEQIGPILQAAADAREIPVLLLLTCGIAESGLRADAFRDDGPTDTSVGPFQQVILYASAYGVGDGTYSAANVALCRAAFADWATSTRVAATELHFDLLAVEQQFPTLTGDEQLLCALSAYNSGHPEAPGNWWWSGPQVTNYRAALIQAKAIGGDAP